MSIRLSYSTGVVDYDDDALPLNPFSFSCWFKPIGSGNGCIVHMCRSLSDVAAGIATSLYITNGGVYLYGIGITTALHSYIPNEWNHLCVVNSGMSLRYIYVNGQQTTDTTFYGSEHVQYEKENIILGGFTGLAGASGDIAEFAIWDSGIMPEHVNMLYNGISARHIMKNNLKYYYPLYETGGTNHSWVHDKNYTKHNLYDNNNDYSSDYPRIFTQSNISYPKIDVYNSLDLFLKCGTSEDCLPYDSGNGAFSSAFGTAFDKQLCGNPPGWHMSLFLDGRQIKSGTNDLYMYGKDSESGIVNLLVKTTDFTPDNSGEELPTTAMNLYLRGPIAHPISSDDVPLFMWSTTNPSLYKTATLYLNSSASGQYSKSINFVVKNELSESYTSTINTFLKAIGNSDGSITYTDEIPLVVYNGAEIESGYITINLHGPSGTDGAVPLSGSMNMFIHRGNNSIAHNHSLYLSGPTQSSDEFNIYLEAQPRPTGTMPVFLFGGTSGVNEFVKLYTHGF